MIWVPVSVLRFFLIRKSVPSRCTHNRPHSAEWNWGFQPRFASDPAEYPNTSFHDQCNNQWRILSKQKQYNQLVYINSFTWPIHRSSSGYTGILKLKSIESNEILVIQTRNGTWVQTDLQIRKKGKDGNGKPLTWTWRMSSARLICLAAVWNNNGKMNGDIGMVL